MNESLKLSEHFLPMDREEMHETQGGIWAAILAGLLIAGGVQILGDWDNFKAGLAGRAEIK